MKKNKGLKIFLIIFLLVLVIAITWLLVSLLTGKLNTSSFRWFSSQSKQLAFEKEYTDIFESIEITSAAGDIFLKETNDDKVKVIIYAKKDNVKVEDENGELNINVDTDFCIGFCFNANSKIEVYLPKEYAGQIKLTNDYGDIEVGDFKTATFDIEEDFGNVEIKSAYKLKVKNDLGDIDVDTVYYSLNLINDCGDITVENALIEENSKIQVSLGDVVVGKTSKLYIDAETELGSVDVEHNYKDADITLKIENDCGDIEVNN